MLNLAAHLRQSTRRAIALNQHQRHPRHGHQPHRQRWRTAFMGTSSNNIGALEGKSKIVRRRRNLSTATTNTDVASQAKPTTSIAVNVNQETIEIPSGSSALDESLLHFLRSRGDTDVKAVCAEGGCGACSVIMSEWDERNLEVVHKSVCACLTPVASLDQKQVRACVHTCVFSFVRLFPRSLARPSVYSTVSLA